MIISHVGKVFELSDKSLLDYDLTFLYGLRERIPLQGNGPRCMVLTEDKLIVPTYFADVLNFMDVQTHGNYCSVVKSGSRGEH